jgi:hypothetical protein
LSRSPARHFRRHGHPELRIVAALNLPVWLAAAVDRASSITSLSELAQKKYPWRVVLPPPITKSVSSRTHPGRARHHAREHHQLGR